jgi:hypothetical protein
MNSSLLHPDDQAELDAPVRTELQNCLEEANLRRFSVMCEESAKITEALNAGRYVVVVDSTFYCRSTDAVVGSVRYFCEAFETRDDARSFLDELYNRSSFENCDVTHVILPELPVEVSSCAGPDFDDLTNEVPF